MRCGNGAVWTIRVSDDAGMGLSRGGMGGSWLEDGCFWIFDRMGNGTHAMMFHCEGSCWDDARLII